MKWCFVWAFIRDTSISKNKLFKDPCCDHIMSSWKEQVLIFIFTVWNWTIHKGHKKKRKHHCMAIPFTPHVITADHELVSPSSVLQVFMMHCYKYNLSSFVYVLVFLSPVFLVPCFLGYFPSFCSSLP